MKNGAHADFRHWRPDALRRFSNPPLLQSEMGHRDSSLLRTRYVNLHGLTSTSAKRFWN